MLTPDAAKRLTPQERSALFRALAVIHYGPSINLPVRRDFNVSERTVQNWTSLGTVPLSVLYTLDAWVNSPESVARMSDAMADVPRQLAQVCKHLTSVAATFARLATERSAHIERNAPPRDASIPGPATSGAEAAPQPD